ncbi:Double-strand break repair protein MRE11, partial [Durusdinium trenchii]
MADELPDGDTLRILVLTDTHVGFNEKDKVRSKDSINTLEEALQVGKSSQADLILHGGDLFHDNKPSRGCLYRTMDLIRQYTMGSGEVAFE